MFKRFRFGAPAAALVMLAGIAGVALAQVLPVPQVQSLGLTDLVQVVPQGIPTASSQYAPVGAVAGVENYSYQIPLTAFAITVPAHVDLLYLNPAGTLATGAVTFEPNPSDGQRFCFQSTQVNTAITYTANTGQSFGGIANPTTYTVANTRLCWFYNRALATWIHYI
jgi:hypothetical protein